MLSNGLAYSICSQLVRLSFKALTTVIQTLAGLLIIVAVIFMFLSGADVMNQQIESSDFIHHSGDIYISPEINIWFKSRKPQLRVKLGYLQVVEPLYRNESFIYFRSIIYP